MATAPFDKLAAVTCTGSSPAEVGHSYGKQSIARIAFALEFYASRFRGCGLGQEAVRSWGEGYERELRAFSPELAEEIAAIAEGADRAAWELFALNARSEILAYGLALMGRTPPSECTSLYCSTSGLLAQNWDWDKDVEALPVLLRIPRRGRVPAILTMTEPGMVAKVGLNDCGVGVCLNFLAGPDAPDAPRGVPVHCLLRLALSCESLAEARQVLKAAPRHCSCHIFLANGLMQYRMLELAGTALECAGADTAASHCEDEAPIEGAEWQVMPPLVVAHTNHYLHPRFAHLSTDLAHTRERYQRVHQIAQEQDGAAGGSSQQLQLVKRILGDTRGAPKSILYDDAPGITPESGPVATICSVIMDLRSQTMHITRGAAAAQEYVQVPLASSSL